MSEAKFTKGPWFVGNYNNLRSSEQDKYSSICVNVSMTLAHDKQNSEYTANANLIAAAPEMYKEIERDIEILKREAEKFVIGSYELRSIRLRIESKQKLLAKARGKS